MSKAFVKENESDFEQEDEIPDPSPGGVKNYITPSGFKALQDELKHLRRVERPKVVETVPGPPGTETGRKTEITSTAKNACARLIAVCAFF